VLITNGSPFEKSREAISPPDRGRTKAAARREPEVRSCSQGRPLPRPASDNLSGQCQDLLGRTTAAGWSGREKKCLPESCQEARTWRIVTANTTAADAARSLRSRGNRNYVKPVRLSSQSTYHRRATDSPSGRNSMAHEREERAALALQPRAAEIERKAREFDLPSRQVSAFA